MNAKRLIKLAEHLENGRPGGHKKFDFTVIHQNHGTEKHCGSVGCAMGELPVVFPSYWKFAVDEDPDEDWGVAVIPKTENHSWFSYPEVAEFFGIDSSEAWGMFCPCYTRWWAPKKNLPSNATAKQVAKSIRQYVAAVKAGKSAENPT